MARRAIYNKDGEIVMGAAGAHARIFGVPALAERVNIPYQTLHKYMKDNFGSVTFERFKELVKATGMTDAEIINLVRR